MLQRFAFAAATDKVAQRHKFRFGQVALELEIQFDSFAPKHVCASRCSAFKRALSILRFLK